MTSGLHQLHLHKEGVCYGAQDVSEGFLRDIVDFYIHPSTGMEAQHSPIISQADSKVSCTHTYERYDICHEHLTFANDGGVNELTGGDSG